MRIRAWLVAALAVGVAGVAGCGSKGAVETKRSGEGAAQSGDASEEERIAEVAKVDKAKYQMRFFEAALKKYREEKGEWPDPAQLATTIGPLLSAEGSLYDPWGGEYSYRMIQSTSPTGESIESPVVFCVLPNQELLYYPER